MPSGWDFGQFPTIFDDVPDDMHCTSDIPHVENLTSPLDSVNPKLIDDSNGGRPVTGDPHNTVLLIMEGDL